MRSGNLIRANRRDTPTVAVDRRTVIQEAIDNCGDDPAMAETKRLLEAMLRDPR